LIGVLASSRRSFTFNPCVCTQFCNLYYFTKSLFCFLTISYYFQKYIFAHKIFYYIIVIVYSVGCWFVCWKCILGVSATNMSIACSSILEWGPRERERERKRERERERERDTARERGCGGGSAILNPIPCIAGRAGGA